VCDDGVTIHVFLRYLFEKIFNFQLLEINVNVVQNRDLFDEGARERLHS
jgi:hypothetical protein